MCLCVCVCVCVRLWLVCVFVCLLFVCLLCVVCCVCLLCLWLSSLLARPCGPSTCPCSRRRARAPVASQGLLSGFSICVCRVVLCQYISCVCVLFLVLGRCCVVRLLVCLFVCCVCVCTGCLPKVGGATPRAKHYIHYSTYMCVSDALGPIFNIVQYIRYITLHYNTVQDITFVCPRAATMRAQSTRTEQHIASQGSQTTWAPDTVADIYMAHFRLGSF